MAEAWPVEGDNRRPAVEASETRTGCVWVVIAASFAEGVVSVFLVLDFLELRASE